MPKKTPAIQLLAPHLDLISIHRVAFAAKRNPILDNLGEGEFPLETTHEIKVHIDSGERRIEVFADFKTQLRIGDEVGMKITALFRLIYAVRDTYKIGDDFGTLAESFSAGSSLVHVWPYWRQFQSDATTQMGLPLLIAPLLLINPPLRRPK